MLNINNINDGDLCTKVQLELERLNTTSDQINEYENKLQNLRLVYSETLSKCSANITEISNKLGPVIPRAKPYFELKRAQIEVQKESQGAASRYETACVLLNHAYSVVATTESLVKKNSKFDDNAMERLNTAILKVNAAKKEQVAAYYEHHKYLSLYNDLNQKIHDHERKHKNDIRKSKDYFDSIKSLDKQLKKDKINIEICEEKIRISKALYNDSLQQLEYISNEMHEQRKLKEMLGPCGEGVGVEKVDVTEIEKNSCKMQNFGPTISSTIPNDGRKICSTDSSIFSDISLVGLRRKSLSSSTPIIHELLRTVQKNEKNFILSTNNQMYRSFPRHYSHSKNYYHEENYSKIIITTKEEDSI